jgi:hypothetical protein
LALCDRVLIAGRLFVVNVSGGSVTGLAQDPGVEAIVEGLTRDIARLAVGKALTVAEFNPTGVGVWKVWPDKCGVPHVRHWHHVWSSLRDWDLLSEGELLDRIKPEDEERIVLARTGQRQPAEAADAAARDADRAFTIAADKYSHATAFTTGPAVDDLLGQATALVPLPASLWYELVGLRRRRSGRLELTAQQLFLPEARRGDTRQFTVQCAASGQRGTAFAVVARDTSLSFELVSMASARIPPGTYQVTATLLRPGAVRFDGLPVRLSADSRSWLDIRAALPDVIDEIKPVHLVLAVERCGTVAEVQERLDRAAQLLDQLHGAAGPVTCSLVTYASHAHNRMTRDEPVTVHVWRQSDLSIVDEELYALGSREPSPAEYPRASQLECMLAAVAERLREPASAGAGRPVLVTIGDKPPFPSRVDPLTGILPCPRRHNSVSILEQLSAQHPSMTFGVIRESAPPGDPSGDAWRRLGVNGSASLGRFDARGFAVGLGLLSATTQYLPLPLVFPGGAD